MSKFKELFRKAKDIEIKIIKNSLHNITEQIWKFILDNQYEIYIRISERSQEKPYSDLFLIPHKLEKEISKIKDNSSIKFSGIPLGFIKENHFYLSLEASELFFKSNIIESKNILVLTEKGEKSILYGNPIKKSMILNISSEVIANMIIFVINKNREFLGLGFSKLNYERIKKLDEEEEVALILIDKGVYLRKSQ